MKVWMQRKLWRQVVPIVLLAVPYSVHAQGGPIPAKPGLWEVQVSVTSKMALPPEVEARIAAMPQAQQDQMRAMMGSRMGGAGTPTSTTRQVCIAPGTSMDSMLSQAQQNPGMKCTFSNREQTATGASFDISCTSATGSATGHSQFHFADDEHASSSMHMTMTASQNGHTMNSTMDSSSSGRFVNADCGTVKPMGAPAQ